MCAAEICPASTALLISSHTSSEAKSLDEKILAPPLCRCPRIPNPVPKTGWRCKLGVGVQNKDEPRVGENVVPTPRRPTEELTRGAVCELSATEAVQLVTGAVAAGTRSPRMQPEEEGEPRSTAEEEARGEGGEREVEPRG